MADSDLAAVAAAHEAGHWAALHALGIDSLGVEYTGVDPAPAANRLAHAPSSVSLHDRRLIAFAGVAAERIMLGHADYLHWAADAQWWLYDSSYGDDPEGRAIELLQVRRGAFDAVHDVLLRAFTAGVPVGVTSNGLREVAFRTGADFGWYLSRNVP
jgi:hypothetical protein